MNATKTFLIDLLERAGKTFYQAAAATLVAELAGSGASLANLPTLAVAEKVGIAASVAGISAVLSLFSSVVSGLKTGTASASINVAESTPTTASVGNHSADVAAASPAVQLPQPGAAIFVADGTDPTAHTDTTGEPA